MTPVVRTEGLGVRFCPPSITVPAATQVPGSEGMAPLPHQEPTSPTWKQTW